MVYSKNGLVKVEGMAEEVMVETVLLLRVVYNGMCDSFGEDEANRLLAGIGKAAVADDDEIGVESIDLLNRG